MRKQVTKFGWVLRMQHTKVNVIPLLCLYGRRPVRLRRCLRYGGRMRGLGGSDVEPRLLLLLQGSRTWRLLRLLLLLLRKRRHGDRRGLVRVRRISRRTLRNRRQGLARNRATSRHATCGGRLRPLLLNLLLQVVVGHWRRRLSTQELDLVVQYSDCVLQITKRSLIQDQR